MMFDDVRSKEPVIKEHFCRAGHNIRNIIFLEEDADVEFFKDIKDLHSLEDLKKDT